MKITYHELVEQGSQTGFDEHEGTPTEFWELGSYEFAALFHNGIDNPPEVVDITNTDLSDVDDLSSCEHVLPNLSLANFGVNTLASPN